MRKLLFVGAMTAAFGTASAGITPFSLYAGYFRSNSFDTSSGRKYLDGPELGISQSLVKLPLLGQVDLGASVLFGGGFGHGSSAKGNLYRIHADYKSPSAGPNGFYFIGGLGAYWAQSSSGSFSNKSGIGTEFGIGLPFKTPIPGAPGFGIEARYRMGPSAVLRGFSIGATLSF